jgi:hypothetical protein
LTRIVSSVPLAPEARKREEFIRPSQSAEAMQFRDMDRNNDGVVTRAEWRRSRQSFARTTGTATRSSTAGYSAGRPGLRGFTEQAGREGIESVAHDIVASAEYR